MKYMNQAKKYLLAASAAVTGFVSSSAMADNATAVTQAFDDAKSLVGLGTTGVITAVALLTGVGIIVSLLKKV